MKKITILVSVLTAAILFNGCTESEDITLVKDNSGNTFEVICIDRVAYLKRGHSRFPYFSKNTLKPHECMVWKNKKVLLLADNETTLKKD